MKGRYTWAAEVILLTERRQRTSC